MKRKIVIVHCASTGFNYVDDIRSRGYEPVIVKVAYAGTEEDKALTATQDMADYKRFKGIQVIPYNSDSLASFLLFERHNRIPAQIQINIIRTARLPDLL